MKRLRNHGVQFEEWPPGDRRLWQAALEPGDLFDEGPGAGLAPATRRTRRIAYGLFLGYLAQHDAGRMAWAPENRCDREVIPRYVEHLRRTCRETTVVMLLERLALVLAMICPAGDWSWLLATARRLARGARPIDRPFVTSERLYHLGRELMNRARNSDDHDRSLTAISRAELFRDGLIVALLAAVPLRVGSFSKFRIGQHLVRDAEVWALEIPAEETKTKVSLRYVLGAELSQCMDEYLQSVRGRFVNVAHHDFVWVQRVGGPCAQHRIRCIVKRRTREAFGFAVTPHRFRNAAATFWSIEDPANVQGSKDLLGHATYATTQQYYVGARTVLAGRAFASRIDDLRASRRRSSRVSNRT